MRRRNTVTDVLKKRTIILFSLEFSVPLCTNKHTHTHTPTHTHLNWRDQNIFPSSYPILFCLKELYGISLPDLPCLLLNSGRSTPSLSLSPTHDCVFHFGEIQTPETYSPSFGILSISAILSFLDPAFSGTLSHFSSLTTMIDPDWMRQILSVGGGGGICLHR